MVVPEDQLIDTLVRSSYLAFSWRTQVVKYLVHMRQQATNHLLKRITRDRFVREERIQLQSECRPISD